MKRVLMVLVLVVVGVVGGCDSGAKADEPVWTEREVLQKVENRLGPGFKAGWLTDGGRAEYQGAGVWEAFLEEFEGGKRVWYAVWRVDTAGGFHDVWPMNCNAESAHRVSFGGDPLDCP